MDTLSRGRKLARRLREAEHDRQRQEVRAREETARLKRELAQRDRLVADLRTELKRLALLNYQKEQTLVRAADEGAEAAAPPASPSAAAARAAARTAREAAEAAEARGAGAAPEEQSSRAALEAEVKAAAGVMHAKDKRLVALQREVDAHSERMHAERERAQRRNGELAAENEALTRSVTDLRRQLRAVQRVKAAAVDKARGGRSVGIEVPAYLAGLLADQNAKLDAARRTVRLLETARKEARAEAARARAEGEARAAALEGELATLRGAGVEGRTTLRSVQRRRTGGVEGGKAAPALPPPPVIVTGEAGAPPPAPVSPDEARRIRRGTKLSTRETMAAVVDKADK